MPPERAAAPETFRFFSEEGRALVRKIIDTRLRLVPHDYQLDGVCKALDGVHVLAIIRTGGGKTGFYLMYITVIVALLEDPTLCRRAIPPVKSDPLIVMVFPTVGLEEEMEKEFRDKGLKTLVINHYTRTEAWERGEDLWKKAERNVSVLLLSPEQLISNGFGLLVANKEFVARVCLLGVDEVHLCNSWGSGFRKSFTQIGQVHARLPKGTAMMLTTATLAEGKPTENILRFFGLHDGEYFLIRHSNIRHDIQILFRVLEKASTSGPNFPDLKEIALSSRKTVIFCPTINHGGRVASYCRKLGPWTPTPDLRVRTYNALNFPYYNTRTLEMFRKNPETTIIVATDSLMVGVNLPNVQDCVIATTPENVDELNQKLGRAGRDSNVVKDARGIVYITKKAVEDAHELADNEFKHKGKDVGGKKAGMDVDLARMIVAQCKTEAQNSIYGNPSDLTGCTCAYCSAYTAKFAGASCQCSGCMDSSEDLPQESAPSGNIRVVLEDGATVEPSPRLGGKSREHAHGKLLALRWRLYLEAGINAENLVESLYLPDSVIKALLDNFSTLCSGTEDSLDCYIRKEPYVLPNRSRIWACLFDIQQSVTHLREAEKAARRERDRERRKAKAVENARAARGEDSDESTSGVESEDETIPGTSTSMAVQPGSAGPSQPAFDLKAREQELRVLPPEPQPRRSTRLAGSSALPVMPLSPRKRKIGNEDGDNDSIHNPSTPPRKYA